MNLFAVEVSAVIHVYVLTFSTASTRIYIHIHLSSHSSTHPLFVLESSCNEQEFFFVSNLFLFDLGSAINSIMASRPYDEYFVWISFLNAFFPECFCLNFLIANYLNSLFVLFQIFVSRFESKEKCAG